MIVTDTNRIRAVSRSVNQDVMPTKPYYAVHSDPTLIPTAGHSIGSSGLVIARVGLKGSDIDAPIRKTTGLSRRLKTATAAHATHVVRTRRSGTGVAVTVIV